MGGSGVGAVGMALGLDLINEICDNKEDSYKNPTASRSDEDGGFTSVLRSRTLLTSEVPTHPHVF